MSMTSTSEFRRLQAARQPASQTELKSIRYRVTVVSGDVYRLPGRVRQFRLLSGIASAAIFGVNISLSAGEEMQVEQGREIIVTAASITPVVLDVQAMVTSAEQERMKREFYERMVERQRLIELEAYLRWAN